MTGRVLACRRLALLVALVVGAGSAGTVWAQGAPLELTIALDGAPAGAVFRATDPIKVVVTVRAVSGADVLTTDGFSAVEFWRRLVFTDPLGRLVINAAEASIHHENRVYHCLSRAGALLTTAIPVVPVELLATGFLREFAMPDGQEARTLFDLSQPGRYRVQARVALQVFLASSVITDCDQLEGLSILDVGASTTATDFLLESNVLEFEVVNTEAGGGVTVAPVDSTTGATPVEVTFASVTSPGATTLTTSGTGSPPPESFSLGNPPVFYDVSTTAGFTPPATVCITYDIPPDDVPSPFADESQLRLFHFEGGAWVDVTTSLDTGINRICGEVSSLSPFAPFQAEAAAPNQPPVANAGLDRTVLTGAAVALDGSGSHDPDGGPQPLTFAWSQAGGPTATLSNAASANPTFTPSQPGAYGFSLTVGDGAGTASDAVLLTALRFDGFLAPVCTATATGTPPSCGSANINRNLLVKFALRNAAGKFVTGPGALFRARRIAPASGPEVTGTFTFDRKEQIYQFTLKTKGLPAGIWQIDATVESESPRSMRIELR